MKIRPSFLAAGLVVTLDCSQGPGTEPEGITAGPVLAFEGTADAFGHPMSPAGGGGRCEIHDELLRDDVVSVLYGLPYVSAQGIREAERASAAAGEPHPFTEARRRERVAAGGR